MRAFISTGANMTIIVHGQRETGRGNHYEVKKTHLQKTINYLAMSNNIASGRKTYSNYSELK